MINLKSTIVLIGTLTFISSVYGFSNEPSGIKFEQSTWEQVKAKAKRLNKPIFVDFYASWCGPCKWMSRDVFTDNEVGEFYNENFISYSVDAENEELDLVESIDLEAYPTLVFFDANGKIILKKVGAMEAHHLISNGRRVISLSNNSENVNNSASYDFEQFKANLSLLKINEPDKAEELALDWLNKETNESITTWQQWQIVSQFIFDTESPYFKYVIENSKSFHDQYDDFLDYVLKVLEVVHDKTIEDQNIALIKVASDIEYKVLVGIDGAVHPSNYYYLNKQYQYYKLIGEYDNYIELFDQFLTKYELENWDLLTDAALEVTDNENAQSKHYEKALTWAKAAYDSEDNFYTNYTLSRAQFRLNNYKEAHRFLKSAQKFSEAYDIQDFLEDYENEIDQFLH